MSYDLTKIETGWLVGSPHPKTESYMQHAVERLDQAFDLIEKLAIDQGDTHENSNPTR